MIFSRNKKNIWQAFVHCGRIFSIILLFAIARGGTINEVLAQETVKTISVKLEDVSVLEALQEVNRLSGNMVTFRKEEVEKVTRKVTLDMRNAKVIDVVKKVLEGTSLGCTETNGRIVVIPSPEEMVEVSGRVVDEKGDPIPGASVIVHGTTQGVATDADGRYTLRVSADAVLQVSFIGYKTETVAVEGKDRINVQLESTSEDLEEVTVVAFGEQKKESVVSAITTVRPMDLKSSSSDLTTQFAGKIAGIVGWQTGGLPGALTEEEMNTKFYVRGITSFQTGANIDPLILLDGVEISKLDLARIAPEDIETFSVMKDASATAMYGARGANGVILVTTKKGEEGNVYTSVRYEAVMSMPTREIDVVSPVDYMRLYNEAVRTRNPNAAPEYSVLDIERRESKNYPSWAYPANDWYDILFKDYNINHRLGINIRGGSKVMQYYASINYNRDMGMLKTDKLNSFDVNIKNSTLSFRANLNVNLHPTIRLLFNTMTNWDKYHGPLNSVAQAYELAFNANPVRFAPTYPADQTYDWDHIRFGNYGAGGPNNNPCEAIQMGYLDRNRYSTVNKLEYIQNLSSLVKGLEIRGSVSLSQEGFYSIPYQTTPYEYELRSYNEATGEHTLYALNQDRASRTIEMGEKTRTTTTQLTYELRAYHTAAWKDHQTSLTAVFNALEQTSDEAEEFLNAVEKRNMGFSMRGTYGYKDRYFAEASFGYNGSERFARKNKLGFFPAGGVAWVASGEPWMQGASKWLSFLKFRLSYGKVGNDGIINEPRFVHLEQLEHTETVFAPVQPGNASVGSWRVTTYANEDIKWEIAEQVNLGLELKMFKGIVDVTVDVYQQIRHNILDYRRTIPANMGVETFQLANVGKARSRGLDFSGKIQHAFTPDFWIILNGTFTYNKATFLDLEEATDKPEWQLKEGHELSQQVGFVDQGLFHDEAEIAFAARQDGDVMPGDIRYRDIDGNGSIDINDAVHIGFPETPRITYGFSAFVNYNNWEFSCSFQGSGRRGFFINPGSISPFYAGTVLQAIADDHWTTDNMKERPLWPRLSTNSIVYHNPQEDWYNYNPGAYKSTYFMRKCRFLRCTGMELAYNLPEKWRNAIRMQSLKVFARANNPFIISNFDLWDVELGEDGFNYPIQKTFAEGLNFSF